MNNIVNLTTKSKVIPTVHAVGTGYTLYAIRKGNRLLRLEIEVDRGKKDITIFYLESVEDIASLVDQLPKEIESKARELLS